MKRTRNKKHSELHSFIISALLHCLVLGFFISLKFDHYSGQAGVIKVFIAEDQTGQATQEVRSENTENKKLQIRKMKRHTVKTNQIQSIKKEQKHPVKAADKEVTEAAMKQETEIILDPPFPAEVDGSQLITDLDMRTERQSSMEFRENTQSSLGASIASGQISPDDVYVGEFGRGDGPKFRKKVMPTYPLYARRSGKEGRVVLTLLIDEEGQLKDVEVIESPGYGFDRSAVKAVRMSTFLPASMNGAPVKSRTKLPIRFELR